MNEKQRCFWVDTISKKYHDDEWGKPSYDDQYLFEMLLLESFQSGLSWNIILKKRESFRSAFDRFDYKKISSYNDEKIEELLGNINIVRSKGKINASINNAKVFQEIQKEFKSFSNYIWSFTDKKIINEEINIVRNRTTLSDIVAKDLKSRGIKYMGSITVYSYLQAIGIVNSHEKECFLYQLI